MSDAPATPAAAPRAPVLDIAKIEAPVRFDLGTATATIGLLETLQAGYVFELDRRITDAVSISVGGAEIGRGELVRVGDRLAVRVVEVHDHASGSS